MAQRVAVRKADADKVLAAVRKAFRPWVDTRYPETQPHLVKDFDWYGHAPYAVVWEGGPYNWPNLFVMGGVEEEFGGRFDPHDTPGVFAEPATGWALSIYPAE